MYVRRAPKWPHPGAKPPVGTNVELNRTHPLAAGMTCCVLWARDLVYNRSHATAPPLQHQRALEVTGAISGYVAAENVSISEMAVKHSLLADPNNWPGIAYSYYVAAGDRFFEGLAWNDGLTYLQPVMLRNTGGFGVPTGSMGALPRVADAVTFKADWPAATGTVYRNGISIMTVPSTGFGFAADVRNAHAIGSRSLSWTVEYYYRWARSLTTAERQWLNTEPYAMLAPVLYRRYFFPRFGGPLVDKSKLTGLLVGGGKLVR